MNLHQLNCFCVLAEVLHYTEASKQLYISQPSLSYAIAELEKELKVELFHRQGNRIVLTKYGEVFLPYAERALLTVQRGTRRMEDMLEPHPSINLGYIYSISGLLSEILRGFKGSKQREDVKVNFFQGLDGQLTNKLRKGQIDLALSTSAGEGSIQAAPLFYQELYLATSKHHRLASKIEVGVEDLADEEFVAITPDSSLRTFIDKAFELATYTPNVVFEAEECNAMASFVGSQFGIAIMPRIPGLDSYDITLIKIKGLDLRRQIYLLWTDTDQLAPACLRLKNYILTEHPFSPESV